MNSWAISSAGRLLAKVTENVYDWKTSGDVPRTVDPHLLLAHSCRPRESLE